MTVTVLLILAIAAVLTPLIQRDLAAAVARRNYRGFVLTIDIDTTEFVEAMRRLARAADEVAALAAHRRQP